MEYVNIEKSVKRHKKPYAIEFRGNKLPKYSTADDASGNKLYIIDICQGRKGKPCRKITKKTGAKIISGEYPVVLGLAFDNIESIKCVSEWLESFYNKLKNERADNKEEGK